MIQHVSINSTLLAEVCRRHHIQRLSLFGSVLRDDFDPTRSDVDVLVEFDNKGRETLTYFKLARIANELQDVLGYRVDLSMADSIHPKLRSRILSTAEVAYDAA